MMRENGSTRLNGKRVLVFGTGISGIGAARLLAKEGAVPVLYDGNEALTPEAVLEKLGEAGAGAEAVIGDFDRALSGGVDLAVLSPGVPTDLPEVKRLREEKIPVWGEVELAWQCSRGQVLAITGTNGKTTTTSLLGAIMRHHMEAGTGPAVDRVEVVGNIGNAYTDAADQLKEGSVAVAEISSFQLETIRTFHPRVSAITNITPDHLNRHHTMEEYIRVKEQITAFQKGRDACVLNHADPVLRGFGEELEKTAAPHPRVIWFDSTAEVKSGYFVKDGAIWFREAEGDTPVIGLKELLLPGRHNHENVMCAAAMAHDFGVPFSEIAEVLRTFRAVEHRIEFVASKGGVDYYNDSKGTNPDAAIKAIEAMDRPTVLLGGGYDKGSSYDEWIRAFGGKVRCLVLVGQTREKIAAAARENGFDRIVMADTFEEAFDACVRAAEPGDAVLLSPACASWGMFPNYEVRGKVFKELVEKLPD